MCADHYGRWLNCERRSRRFEILFLGLLPPLRLYRWNINLQEKLEVYGTLSKRVHNMILISKGDLVFGNFCKADKMKKYHL